jgi:type I restriction enzyme R subunit
VERWQGNEVSDPEAVEALQAVEAEILDVQEEAEEQGMDDAEFAVYTHLTEETDAGLSENEAEAVAQEIVSQFHERVDRNYPGWKTNQQTISEVERILLDVLVVERDLGYLIQNDDEFVDSIREYLIQNHG